MGVKHIKVKVLPGRGDCDARSIIKAIVNNWDDVQEQIKTSYSEEEQQVIREHFNKLFEDHVDFGDCFLGSKDDFEDKIATIDDDELKQFTGELISNKAIDESCLAGGEM